MPDSTVEILIKTSAELAGAKAAADSLERQIGAAKALGKEYGAMEVQLRKARATIAQYDQGQGGPMARWFDTVRQGLRDIVPGFEKFEGLLGKLGTGTAGLISAGFVALGAAIKVAAAGLKEYAEAEVKVAAIDAALAQRGLLSDANREKMQQLASELQNVTAISQDQWLPVIAQLIKFGADTGNIEKYTDAVKNLAGALGGDLQTAAMLVAKAIQGNYQMFARYGIVIEDVGTQTEKFDKLCQQLAERGGGQLDAMAKTLTGRWHNLKNQIKEIIEPIGGFIAHITRLNWFLEGTGNMLEYWGQKISTTVPQVQGLTNALEPTTQRLDESSTAAGKLAGKLGDIETAAKKDAEALQKLIAAQAELSSHEEGLLQKRKALALAQIDAGPGTNVQKAAGRLRVETTFARAGLALKEDQAKRATETETQEAESRRSAEQDMESDIAVLEGIMPVATRESARRMAQMQAEIAQDEGDPAQIAAAQASLAARTAAVPRGAPSRVELQKDIDAKKAELARYRAENEHFGSQTFDAQLKRQQDLYYFRTGAQLDQATTNFRAVPQMKSAIESDLKAEQAVTESGSRQVDAFGRYHGAVLSTFKFVNERIDKLARELVQQNSRSAGLR